MVSAAKNHKKNAPFTNGMSIDVEDWFQVWALSDAINQRDWDNFDLRVVASTRRAMDLLDQHKATATFFTLGWVAQRCPALIKEIIDRGHELASHGMKHDKVFDLSQKAFLDEARDSKKILEDISGTQVRGFRAAGFSFDDRTPWAHDVLREAGYAYSSSIHPIAHDHYSNPNAPQRPYNPIRGSNFLEIPVATAEIYGKRFSCAGGGWFRLLPYHWTKLLFDRFHQQQQMPGVFYFHPWEIDPDQPVIKNISLKSRLRHYTNLDRMAGKLSRLMQEFSWSRLDKLYLDKSIKEAA